MALRYGRPSDECASTGSFMTSCACAQDCAGGDHQLYVLHSSPTRVWCQQCCKAQGSPVDHVAFIYLPLTLEVMLTSCSCLSVAHLVDREPRACAVQIPGNSSRTLQTFNLINALGALPRSNLTFVMDSTRVRHALHSMASRCVSWQHVAIGRRTPSTPAT